jgi:putative protease
LTEEHIEQVGIVKHYYGKIGVAVVELSAMLAVGDTIRVKGATTDFRDTVQSMQIEHKNIQRAEAGQSIGLKLSEKAREGDIVYKVLK